MTEYHIKLTRRDWKLPLMLTDLLLSSQLGADPWAYLSLHLDTIRTESICSPRRQKTERGEKTEESLEEAGAGRGDHFQSSAASESIFSHPHMSVGPESRGSAIPTL